MAILYPNFGEDWSIIIGLIRKYWILSPNSFHLLSLTWLLISKRIFRSIAKHAVKLSRDPHWCYKYEKNIKFLPAKNNLETKSHFDLFTYFYDFSYFNTIIFRNRFYFLHGIVTSLSIYTIKQHAKIFTRKIKLIQSPGPLKNGKIALWLDLIPFIITPVVKKRYEKLFKIDWYKYIFTFKAYSIKIGQKIFLQINFKI